VIDLASDALRGSYPPIITPFVDGTVDESAYVRLLEFQIREGSHGIVVNGTTAEPSVLSVAERKRIAELAMNAVAHRLPIMVATGSQSHAETVELTEHAEEIGADAVLIVTPYYIRPPQRGLVAYFADLGARTTLPMLVYHIPGRAAVDVTIDTLAQIADSTPNFVGIKHAVADLGLVSDMLARFGPDFRVFVGLEELSFPMLALGAAGMVNAIGNIAPRHVVDLFEAVAAGDLTRARALHYELLGLNRAVFFDTNPIPLKYMMRRVGLLDRNEHRLPMMPATPELEERLNAVLRDAGIEPLTVIR
jgi:4-hydroxy-tetrahydrodipicolinate synthase